MSCGTSCRQQMIWEILSRALERIAFQELSRLRALEWTSSPSRTSSVGAPAMCGNGRFSLPKIQASISARLDTLCPDGSVPIGKPWNFPHRQMVRGETPSARAIRGAPTRMPSELGGARLKRAIVHGYISAPPAHARGALQPRYDATVCDLLRS